MSIDDGALISTGFDAINSRFGVHLIRHPSRIRTGRAVVEQCRSKCRCRDPDAMDGFHRPWNTDKGQF